jgi:hypothetical protein
MNIYAEIVVEITQCFVVTMLLISVLAAIILLEELVRRGQVEEFLMAVTVEWGRCLNSTIRPFTKEQYEETTPDEEGGPMFKESVKMLEEIKSWLQDNDINQIIGDDIDAAYQRLTKKLINKPFYVLDWGSRCVSQKQMILAGIICFNNRLNQLPVDAIIVGHGCGDGRFPRRWYVADRPATQWMRELGIETALVHSCEDIACRYVGAVDGRIVKI